jgi:hypothetical protein
LKNVRWSTRGATAHVQRERRLRLAADEATKRAKERPCAFWPSGGAPERAPCSVLWQEDSYISFAGLTAIPHAHRLLAYAVLLVLEWWVWRLLGNGGPAGAALAARRRSVSVEPNLCG